MQSSSWEVTVVRVESGLNEDTASSIRQQSSLLLSRPGPVILDVREASLDSSALCAVLSLQQRLDLQGRRLLVVATDPRFVSLVERAGVGDSFRIFGNAEEALRHTRERSAAAA